MPKNKRAMLQQQQATPKIGRATPAKGWQSSRAIGTVPKNKKAMLQQQQATPKTTKWATMSQKEAVAAAAAAQNRSKNSSNNSGSCCN
jgi:hypothetical protein